MRSGSVRDPAANPPVRLLVRGVNWLGDAVMTTPALLRLREALPATRIILLTGERLADLWPSHPAVDQVVTFNPGANPLVIGRRLRPLRIDTALIFPNSVRSALEPWTAGISRRIGYARPWRNWLLTRAVPPRSGAVRMRKPSRREIHSRLEGSVPASRPDPSAHHCHDYLQLAAVLGARPDPIPPALAISATEIAKVRERFGLSPETLWLGLSPGAEYGPAKRWPAERFARVAAEVTRRTAARWIILGGRGDRAMAEVIAREVPDAVNLAGRTTLRELMAVLALCPVVLTNDTGPMHVAAAVGSTVIALFGSTSPELTGPGLPGDSRHRIIRSDAPCAPCFLRECPIDFRCMLGVSGERVMAEVMELVRPIVQG
jgi:heptosyltransferase-2